MFFPGDIVRVMRRASDSNVGWSDSMTNMIDRTGYIMNIHNLGYPNVKFPGRSAMHFCPQSLDIESDMERINEIERYRTPTDTNAIG